MTKTYTPTRRDKLKIFFEKDAFEHNVFTPFELCTKIISQVDVSDRNILVMNPEFALVLIEEFGVEPRRITIFADVDPIIETIARRMGINYIDAWNYNMRFDVVFGNPPYSDSGKSSASNKLWGQFVERSIDVLDDDGVCAMITPTGWISPTSKYHNVIKERLQFANISISVSDAFAGVGGSQRFGWYIMSKLPNQQMPTVVFDDGQGQIDITSTACPPVKTSSIHAYSIIDKVFKTCNEVYSWQRTTDKHGSGISMPMAKSPSYEVAFSDADEFNFERYYLSCDENLGRSLAHNLNSKLYCRIRWWIRSGVAIAGNFKQLPIPSCTMSDEELYSYFNLSAEEVSFIEND